MGGDSCLNRVNQKTWKYTKAIMLCNVLAFLSVFCSIIFYLFEQDALWSCCIGASMLWICLAVHYAWALEEKL